MKCDERPLALLLLKVLNGLSKMVYKRHRVKIGAMKPANNFHVEPAILRAEPETSARDRGASRILRFPTEDRTMGAALGGREGCALTFGVSNVETDERLKELILYVCDKCIDDPDFGVTKLNKIILYSDFTAFRSLGSSITGGEYMRQDRGPVPRHFKPVAMAMKAKGELAIREVPHYADPRRTQHRYIALRSANIGLFRAEEIAIIDRVVGVLDGLNARDVSDMTHGYVWRAVPNGGSIPYEAAFISDEPLNEGDVEWARRANDKYKWETVKA